MKLKKILFFIFALLILITAGELSYYLYFRNIRPNSSSPVNPQKIVKITPNQDTLDVRNPKHLDTIYRKVNPHLVIDAKVIDTLIFYQKGVLQSSIINNTHKGKILTIERKKEKAYYDYYEAVLKIKIAAVDNEDITSTFYFSEDDLSKTQFFQRINNEDKPITVTQLMVGDIIIIEDSFDATKTEPIPKSNTIDYLEKSWGYNRIKVRITKL